MTYIYIYIYTHIHSTNIQINDLYALEVSGFSCCPLSAASALSVASARRLVLFTFPVVAMLEGAEQSRNLCRSTR